MFGQFVHESIQTFSSRAMSAFAVAISHARLEARDPAIDKAGQGLFMLIEGQRHQEVEVVIENPEAARHDAYDLARLRIKLDHPPHDRAVAAEASLPVSVAKHDALGASGILVGRVKPSAGSRRNGEGLEHAIADQAVFTCSGCASPVTFAVAGCHTPTD